MGVVEQDMTLNEFAVSVICYETLSCANEINIHLTLFWTVWGGFAPKLFF